MLRSGKNCGRRDSRRLVVDFLPLCGRPEDPDIDFEYVAVSWKLVAAAVNGTLAGVVVLLFATEFCILNCLFICPPLARG
jgi:hypothetical protein